MKIFLRRTNYSFLAIGAAILLSGADSRAQLIVYDNLNTVQSGNAYGEPNGNNLVLGDSLTLTQGGKLGLIGVSLYNADGSGGVIEKGTLLVKIYDNTVAYSGGTLSNPLLGQTNLTWDFTGQGGLQDGFIQTNMFDLSALNITLPTHILVTQQFTETLGTSGGAGAVLFSDPDVGSSPETVYISSSATPAALYSFGGIPSQFGYQIQLNTNVVPLYPVATAQSLVATENAATAIKLTGTDGDGDTLTYHIVNGPTNGTLTGTAPNVTYQPNTNYAGPDAFTFVVNDGSSNSAPALVSITVTAGLIIIPQYDSSILNDANVIAITNTINNVIQTFEGLYGDSVTVNVRFQEMGSGLGQNTTYVNAISYSSLVSALTSHAKTTNDAIVLAHLPGGAANPVNGGANVTLTLPNLRALGLSGNPPTNYDGIIFVNMSIVNVTRTSIDANKYDLNAVVSHEMDEVLGSGSGIGQANISPEDLFRYTSNGVRTFTTSGDNAFLSIDGGATDLVRFNQSATGDYGDFWSISAHSPVRVQDAFATKGTTPNLTVEKTVLDVLGWYLVSALPQPVFQPATVTNGTVHLTWSSVSGDSYQLQFKSNLVQTAWSNLGSPITATGATTTTTDAVSTNKQRFYRVVQSGSSPPAPLLLPGQEVPGPPTTSTRYFLPAPE